MGESATHHVFEDLNGNGTTLITTTLGSIGPGDGEATAEEDVELLVAEPEEDWQDEEFWLHLLEPE
eukprot:7011453-Heterocapsa_arctica.AAC.1